MITSAWELSRILLSFIGTAFCLGYIFNSILLKKARKQESLFLMFITGVTIFYSMVMTGVSIDLMVFCSKIISALFLYYLFYKLFYSYSISKIKQELTGFAFLTAGLLLCFRNLLKVIVYEPISAWDARSVWYFRAKQLFFNDRFSETLGICSAGCPTSFSHAHYPFMVPSIGAFISADAGFWNEFLPKSNLLILFAGALIFILSLKQQSVFFKAGLILTLFSINPWMVSNGYMDAWLGIYTAFSITFISEYLRTFKKEYLYTAVCSFIFIGYIKDEGHLLSLAVLSSVFFLLLLNKNSRLLKYTFQRIWQAKFLILMFLIPAIVWKVVKIKFNYYSIDYNAALLINKDVWLNFVSSEKYKLIYLNFVKNSELFYLIVPVILVSVFSLIFKYRLKESRISIKMFSFILLTPIISTAIFYFFVCLIYYSSYIDISWHLATSAERLREHLVYMPAVSMIYGFSAFMDRIVWK